MLSGGFPPSGCERRGWNFPLGPLEEVLKKIKGNGKALGKKGKEKKKSLKRIPTKPTRRLSPSAPGKGELEGSGLRLANRILLLQTCQNCIHYICTEKGGRKLCIFNASQERAGRVLESSFGFFLRTKSLTETSEHGRLSVHMHKDSQWYEDLNFP